MFTLGRRVKDIRIKHGLTQQQFAESVGISQAHLSSLENNKYIPSKSVTKLISIYYGVDENLLHIQSE